jgi:hypothetical protein
MMTSTGFFASIATHTGTESKMDELAQLTSSNERQTASVVTGTVRDRDGTPLAGMLIRAFDRALTRDVPLGEPAHSDRHGRYCLEYTGTGCDECGTGPALVVRAYGRAREVIAESAMLYDASAKIEVDLMVGGGTYQGPSEYEQITAKIRPCLDGVLASELTQEQISYLAARTGLSAQFLQIYVWAAQQLLEIEVPAEALYGLVREGLPMALPQLLAQPADTRRAALEKALADNLVPLRLAGELDAIERAVESAAVQQALKPPDVPGQLSIGAVLTAARLSTPLQQKFVTQYRSLSGSPSALWDAVRKDPELGPHVSQIQLSIQLTAVARSHMPLVDALQQRATTLRDLAKLTDSDWSQLVARSGTPPDVPGANDAEKAANYARTLARTLEVLIPSAIIAARVQQDPALGTPEIRTFFAANPNFDFATDHVETFMAIQPPPPTAADTPKLTQQLKRMQRAFRMTPRYSDISYLLANGLDSAQRVAQMGRGEFLAQHGNALGGSARAGDIFDRARQIAATVALLFARFSPQMNAAHPTVIPSLPISGG